jgi:hypothetical protein
MATSFKVPVTGTNVNAAPTAEAQGPGDLPTSESLATLPATAATPESETGAGTAQTPAPSRELFSPNRRFTPDFDENKYQLTFNQYGRVVMKPRAEAVPEPPPETKSTEETGPDSLTEGLPELDTEPAIVPSQPAMATTDPMAAIQNQINNLTQVVLHLARSGQTNQPTTATEPAEPEYARYDLSDPAQLDSYIKDQISQGVSQGLKMHTSVEQEVNRQIAEVSAKHGQQAFKAREPMLVELSKANPNASVQDLWNLSENLLRGLVPAPTTAAPARPAAQQASRTITTEQARQKAEQAKRLPQGNNGVKGAGQSTAPPPNIKGLGNLMAWHISQRGTRPL